MPDFGLRSNHDNKPYKTALRIVICLETVRTFLLSLFFLPSLFSADVTGKWVAEMNLPNGDKREQVYFLKQDGSTLTGGMRTQFGDEPFTDGAINGDELSFVMVNGDRRMTYKGKLEGDQLKITLQPPPGMGPGGPPPGGAGGGFRGMREMVAKRVSNDPSFTPPPPLPPPNLPELKALADNKLARTPPMGWNSWNLFARRIDDKTVREMADALVSSGMRDAGYVYLNIDDTWQGKRDANGVLQPNEKFPDMKALADYVHSKGLKIGIYSSPGPRTCAGFEGSYAHEEIDARTWAAWGFDYLKYDWCSAPRVYKPEQMRAAYQKMGEALRATGRPIIYSLCQYGQQNVGTWGALVGGNLWRTTGDIRDQWASMERIGFDQQTGLEKNAGPGRWNDPDMLEIGNGHMTTAEYQTHMSLWSMLASPLLAGNDVRNMTPEIKAILMNKEVIAVDQDKLGHQAAPVWKEGKLEVWARPLADGSRAVALFNRGDAPAKITARWSDAGVKGPAAVRDLWAHKDLGKFKDEFTAEVPSHGTVMLKVK